ncbi:MAG: purine-nucleoside phosphorylase [Chloroflexota bacterium]
METLGKHEISQATQYILTQTRKKPRVGLILGSGLGELADSVENADRIPYRSIPHFRDTSVQGHQGRLVVGRLEGQTVAVLQGRVHFYEGYSMSEVGFPVRVLGSLGCEILIVTNAAGGLNRSYEAGDLMLITDHIYLPGMAGHHPLRGPNDASLGPRFPDMAQPYDLELRQVAQTVAAKLGIPLRLGVYVMVAGPSYETPAEVAFLRLIGADAVGMSTAPEVVVARHAGLRVLGISCISNMIPSPGEVAGPMVAKPPHGGHGELGHEEVLATAAQATPRLLALIRGILQELSRPEGEEKLGVR